MAQERIRILFKPPGTTKQYETAIWIYGDLHTKKIPLIVIHGGPGCPSSYLNPLAQLHQSHGIPIILYDQVGCGESTRLPETKGYASFWTIELFLAELRNLLAHLNLPGYDLLGQSWGGMLAGEFALTQPKGLRKLIIYSSPASFPLRMEAGLRYREALPAPMRHVLVKGDTDESVKATKEWHDAMMHYTRTHMCRVYPWPAPMQQAIDALNEDDTVSGTMYPGLPFAWEKTKLVGWDITPRLPEITKTTVPGGILVINGRYDTVDDASTEAWSTEPKARVKWVKFEESSHMAHFEEPEKFFAEVAGFLEDGSA
ncbi:hypothetical protein LTR22_025792 [Elasticomyces elasticus]|nr:hypothetical protein LTR22_025792 [Elasticomyces elasticus]